MALLSTDALYERGRKESNVLEKTNSQPYRVGKRVWDDNGYLLYGPGDYVSKEEALRLGIISEEPEEETTDETPPVSASRGEWDSYAREIGVNPNEYTNKQSLIDAVYEHQQSGGSSESNDSPAGPVEGSSAQPDNIEVDSSTSSPEVSEGEDGPEDGPDSSDDEDEDDGGKSSYSVG